MNPLLVSFNRSASVGRRLQTGCKPAVTRSRPSRGEPSGYCPVWPAQGNAGLDAYAL